MDKKKQIYSLSCDGILFNERISVKEDRLELDSFQDVSFTLYKDKVESSHRGKKQLFHLLLYLFNGKLVQITHSLHHTMHECSKYLACSMPEYAYNCFPHTLNVSKLAACFLEVRGIALSFDKASSFYI